MRKHPSSRIFSAVLSTALVLSLAPAALAAEPDAAGQETAAPSWGDGNVYVTDLDKTGTAASFVGVDGNPYFRMRDLAYIFTGSEHQFNVAWIDGQVVVTSGAAYDGEVLALPETISSADRSQTPSEIIVSVDGTDVAVPAIAVEGHYYLTVESFNTLLGTDATVQEREPGQESAETPEETAAPEETATPEETAAE